MSFEKIRKYINRNKNGKSFNRIRKYLYGEDKE